MKKALIPNQIAKPDSGFSQCRLIRIHPVWYSFIKFCEVLGYGEIDKLKIEDGLPMLAEEVKKKIKFAFNE